MMKMRFFLLLAVLLVPDWVRAQERLSVVRVNVTTQGWDFQRPWGKRQPMTRRAIGAVLPGGRVLVTGDLAQNATYLEFETPEGGRKVPAKVAFVDYEANLAVLQTEDGDFLEGIPTLEIAPSKIGDMLTVWQLENNGRLLETKGPLTTAEMIPYPLEGVFMAYRITVQMQNRDSSFTLPVVNSGKLTGILMSYDAQSNNANLIPAPVIEHFLKDGADGKYDGFPRAGYAQSPMRDPALRRFANVPETVQGGVYVTEVVKDSPAAKAGMQKGDVIVSVAGFAIDQDGNYADPQYGKVTAAHLLSTQHFVGDKVAVEVLRNGQRQKLELTMARRDPASFVSDPYIIDRAPRFYIVGGFLLQELSREWLRSYGNDWMRRAPERAVFADRYQSELFKDGPRKVVLLTRVLPTAATVGYENLSGQRVTRINGVDLQSLDDVPGALDKPMNGLHKIEFDHEPRTVFLDAVEAVNSERIMQTQYRLPTTKRLE